MVAMGSLYKFQPAINNNYRGLWEFIINGVGSKSLKKLKLAKKIILTFYRAE